MSGLLTCIRCTAEKPEEEFDRDRKHPTGRRRVCKQCRYARDRENAYRYAAQGWTQRYRSLVSGSRRRKHWPNDLDEDFVLALHEAQGGLCALSGVPLSYEAHHPYTASLDRIDSSIGYLKGNVQIVTATVNRMKMNLDQAEFLSVVRQIHCRQQAHLT